MSDLLLDFRYAARALVKRPTLVVAATLTLALCIGATTAIYSVVNGVLLRPLDLPNADRLVSLCEQFPGASPDWCGISPPNVEDIAQSSGTIDAIGIGRAWSWHLATTEGAVEIRGGLASPGLFTALGVRPALGRLIEPTDMLGRDSDVALLSYEMWQSRYGGDSSIVGRSVVLSKHPVTIVGVVQPGFQLPKFENVELWRPLHIDPRAERHREWRGFVAYGRLREGASMANAAAELRGIVTRLRSERFATTPAWDIRLQSLHDLVVGGVKPTLLAFMGAVMLVLLIGCANVANLLLARATGRSREMALRAALGAARARIVRALLAESLLLALAGAVGGVVLAYWGVKAFKALAPASIPRIAQVTVDGNALAFALALAGLTALLFGLAPALRAASSDLIGTLREGGRGSTRHGGGAAAGLVVAELALAVMLVAMAGLLTRSFVAGMSWRPGFERDHLAIFSQYVPNEKYSKRDDLGPLWERLESELAAIPGVAAAATASAGPLFGGRESWEVEIQGLPPTDRPSVRWYDVSPGFFATLGVPIVRGRDLDRTASPGAPLELLVNETLVKRFWPNDDPLGRHIVFGVGADRATFTVVGVTRDIPPAEPGRAPDPEMFWSNRQLPRPFTYFLVRTTVPPASVADAIRSRMRAVDRDFDVRAISGFPELMRRQLTRPRFNVLLLATFGALALLLAGIGTYGLLAYAVAERTREIAIRIALGAGRPRIVRVVVGRALLLAGIGAGLGAAGALAAARGMSAMMPGVSPRDPTTLVAAVAVLLATAAIAALLPALRASRVSAGVALSAD